RHLIRHCERSEAIQRPSPQQEGWIASAFAPRNDGEGGCTALKPDRMSHIATHKPTKRPC
ncbi:MAG: hypothetical protein ACJ8DL_22815, partial [Microvirga sp.]